MQYDSASSCTKNFYLYSVKSAFIKEHRLLIIILCVALIIRLLLFIRFEPWNTDMLNRVILIFDSLGYHQLALCIKNEFSFCGNAFRTPAYPFFVSLVYLIFGESPKYVLFLQIFINLGSIMLMYRCGKLLFGMAAGNIAAFLFSIDLHHIVYIYYLLTETLYTFIFLSALYLFLLSIKQNRLVQLCIAGILLGISTLIRPISQYYVLCVAVFTFIYFFMQNKKKAFSYTFILLACYYVTIAPWCLRNYKLYGAYKVSNIQGYNLLFWNASYYEAKRQHKTIEEINKSFETELQKRGWRYDSNPFLKEKLDGEMANEILSAHFPDYLKTHLTGTVKIHLSLGTQSLTDVLRLPAKKFTEEEKYTNGVFVLIQKFFKQKTIYEILLGLYVALFLAVVYSFAAIGVWRMIKERQTLLMLFLLGSAGYFVLISGIISYARYRLPSMPFYILLASCGMVWCLQQIKEKKQKTG